MILSPGFSPGNVIPCTLLFSPCLCLLSPATCNSCPRSSQARATQFWEAASDRHPINSEISGARKGRREGDRQQRQGLVKTHNQSSLPTSNTRTTRPTAYPKRPLYLCTLPRNGESNRKQGRHKKQHYHHANHHGSAKSTQRQGSHRRQDWA